MQLSNIPPKGTQDWFPQEFKIRKHIFDTWRQVCLQFGYEEYLTPIVEYAQVYYAKSGEDVGGKELTLIQDRGGREIALRPEMTPSVSRLVSREYTKLPKPIRYFSIANFFRNERPQRGRNREFWQLNFDLFGSNSLIADVEIISMGIEIMKTFGAPKDSFCVKINNRKLISSVLKKQGGLPVEKHPEISRILDKFEKLEPHTFHSMLRDAGLDTHNIDILSKFMSASSIEAFLTHFPDLCNDEGIQEIQHVISSLQALNYSEYIQFSPSLIRGFDYYNGTIFEFFDNHPDNSRSMFGGGRYNGLANIFESQTFASVGMAPGDETTRIFLESWKLLEHIQNNQKELYFLPLLDETYSGDIQKLAQVLRHQGKSVEIGLEKKSITKALNYANKKNLSHVVLFGSHEKQSGEYRIKNMQTGEENEFKI